jgi:hypothetical protein
LAVAALSRVSPKAVAARRTATASRLGLLTSRVAIEDRNAADQPAAKPVAERPGQQNPIPEAKSQQSAPAKPPRLGLAGLKAAAQARRARLVAAK